MTKINRISIHGFKSFAHKTDIQFDNKYNCILGPNGSGKSNVGDAICFVLGRLSAKSLRAEKAANLIFSGGKDKKPSSQGTVEIAFDNSTKAFPDSAPEVVISRTITKDGTSIYRINGKKLTRTEIVDFLANAKINPDGYNIILQGDITRFVDMPALERRQIIEEISDVTVYEEKKHKALLELQKVEEQLNNAEIILKERQTYLKELKKDRDQALKFKELKDRIDSNKATFLHLQVKEKEDAQQKIEQEISKHQEKIKSAEEKINGLKQKIAVHKEKIADTNRQIEQKGEHEQVKMHKDLEDIKVTLAKEKTRISTLKDEINKIQQRKEQFRQEIKELEEKSSSHSKQQKEVQSSLAQRRKELPEWEQKISQFKKTNNIESSQDIEKEIEEKDKLIEQKQEEVQTIRQKQQDLLREKDKLEFQVQSIDERMQKVKEVEKENKDQIKLLQDHKTTFKSATLKLNQLLDQDSSFSSQIGNARKKLAELQQLEAQLRAKTASLEALPGNQALKSILSNKAKFKGVYGTIAELGNVPRKYTAALETAAGNKMFHIVVEDDDVAAQCIKHLQQNKAGSASFVPLNKIKSQTISEEDKKLTKQSGVHDFALNTISFKPKFQKAFEYVFGNTLIVDDIDVARKVGIGKIKMATVDGNLAEASGVMRGGYRDQRKTIGFQEKDSLEELEKAEKELAEWEGVLANLTTKREANEKEIAALRTQKAELEGEIIKLEKMLHLETGDLNASLDLKKELQQQLAMVTRELQSIQKDITTINTDLTNLKSKKQTLRSQVSELRNPRLLAQLTAFEEAKQSCRETIIKLENELKNSAVHLEQVYSPELEKIKEIIKQHDKEEQQFGEEIKTLTSSVTKKEQELLQKEKASKEFYSKYRELFTQREKINTEITKWENDIESIRDTSRSSERDVNMVSLRNAELKAKLAGLQEEFNRYKDVPLLSNKTPEELHHEIAKFEVMLSQMSAVNMKALEVYEQVETEFNKLVEKKGSLEGEKTDVLTLMNEIETKKKDHFMRTFTEVNTNFQRIFTSLFKKGKAYLQLNNPNKPFDDGLSVKVKLTGNRYLDLKALSGGEKTLTALSLIFAIQEHQPASFYVLDEIDAALDKHNSETLAKLLRSYSQNAQYVVISHNDSIISEADTLFGVSMNDGVSKVTSLKI